MASTTHSVKENDRERAVPMAFLALSTVAAAAFVIAAAALLAFVAAAVVSVFRQRTRPWSHLRSSQREVAKDRRAATVVARA